ncbi:MAG: NAD-dependent epimerase/dehydratase [Acidobacteriaceae bacterium]|nr:NAD-dependent epimerase/dehydratase [Acidobacteriaceae bacterium]
MSNSKILVTGGAGFIGSHLVDALVERGHEVRILDKLIEQVHGTDGPGHLNPHAELIQADICDENAIRRALDGVEVVYHQAAEVGVGQSMYEPERYMRANTMGTTILLEAIRQRRAQIKKLVVASSMSIYGEGGYHCSRCGNVAPPLRSTEQLRSRRWELECPRCKNELLPIATSEDKPLFPTSVYAISKQDQEQLCLVMGRAYGIPTIAFRYFNVYGTRQALSNPYTGVCAIFCSRLLNDRPPLIFEDGEQSRDFIHVSDIVQANLLALESDAADFHALNIGTGSATSVTEMSKMLAEGLGKDVEPQIVGEYRQGDIRHCVADITRAKTLLGYAPKVELKEGLNDLLEWVKEQSATDLVEQARLELTAHNLVQ